MPILASSWSRFAHFKIVILPSVVLKISVGPFSNSGALLSCGLSIAPPDPVKSNPKPVT